MIHIITKAIMKYFTFLHFDTEGDVGEFKFSTYRRHFKERSAVPPSELEHFRGVVVILSPSSSRKGARDDAGAFRILAPCISAEVDMFEWLHD